MAEAQDIILHSGSDSILFAHKAFNFLENQQYDEALAICEAGVKQFPFYAEGHFILGKCYQTLKNYSDAKNEYERTLIFMPGHIRAMNALAFIYYKMDLAPKAKDLLIQASLYNPFNTDLIGYLKSENLYNSIYSTSGDALADVDAPVDEQQPSGQSDLDIDIEDDVTRELISEINELTPESSQDELADMQSDEWQEAAEPVDAEDLASFDSSGDELDDSSMHFEDSEIAALENESVSDIREDGSNEIEFNIDGEKEPDDNLNVIESELNDVSETDIRDAGPDHFNIEDSAIDDSFLDDSFIGDNSDDEFYLESAGSANKDMEEDEDITRIDEFASSKDEVTELSIEQYEVNNIVDNIIESDSKEDTKTDLSKFANTEDDFSSLMNGIFEEREPEESDDAFSENDLDEFDEDETQMAEERPILDTSIIFMDREKQELGENEDKSEDAANRLSDVEENIDLQDEEIEFDLDENEDFSLDDDEEDIDLGDINLTDEQAEDVPSGDDDISKMIDEIDKKGDQFISNEDVEDDVTELYDQPRVEALPVIEDENASIDEILNNPKMLTPTFGEILIAQKKFGDAQRVFKELLKKDPENKNLNRKMDFLNKLVKLKN